MPRVVGGLVTPGEPRTEVSHGGGDAQFSAGADFSVRRLRMAIGLPGADALDAHPASEARPSTAHERGCPSSRG